MFPPGFGRNPGSRNNHYIWDKIFPRHWCSEAKGVKFPESQLKSIIEETIGRITNKERSLVIKKRNLCLKKQSSLIRTTVLLTPHYPPVYLYRLGFAQFNLELYNDAAASLEESILRDPDFLGSRDLLVATYGHLNRIHEAIAIYKELSEKPDCRWYLDFKEEADQKRWCSGLQKAGLQPQ